MIDFFTIPSNHILDILYHIIYIPSNPNYAVDVNEF